MIYQLKIMAVAVDQEMKSFLSMTGMGFSCFIVARNAGNRSSVVFGGTLKNGMIATNRLIRSLTMTMIYKVWLHIEEIETDEDGSEEHYRDVIEPVSLGVLPTAKEAQQYVELIEIVAGAFQVTSGMRVSK
jgi:hypothetical protein